MKGTLFLKGDIWFVQYQTTNDFESIPLHPDDSVLMSLRSDKQPVHIIGEKVEFDMVKEYDEMDINKFKRYAKLITPMVARLREHLNSITPEQFEQEIKDIEGSMNFICKDPDCVHCAEDMAQMEDGDLTDDEWLIKQKHWEIEATAIDFAEWIGKNDWMSIWVEDKWMWEYQSTQYAEELQPSHKWFGYKTNEELFELYKASKQ